MLRRLLWQAEPRLEYRNMTPCVHHSACMSQSTASVRRIERGETSGEPHSNRLWNAWAVNIALLQ